MLGFLESGTIQQALELLELDGETPTLEQLSNIDICNTTVKKGSIELAICGLSDNGNDTYTAIYIDAGYWCQGSQGVETGLFIHIALTTDGADIQYSEL